MTHIEKLVPRRLFSGFPCINSINKSIMTGLPDWLENDTSSTLKIVPLYLQRHIMCSTTSHLSHLSHKYAFILGSKASLSNKCDRLNSWHCSNPVLAMQIIVQHPSTFSHTALIRSIPRFELLCQASYDLISWSHVISSHSNFTWGLVTCTTGFIYLSAHVQAHALHMHMLSHHQKPP